MFHADNQIRIRDEGQILQRFLQVTRTYFAGSTGAVNGLGEADLGFFGHHAFLCLCSQSTGTLNADALTTDRHFVMESVPYLYKKREYVK
jgi:hypothetical protein